MTSPQHLLMDSPDKGSPIIHLDITRDDPVWQKVSSPNHVKYPPLRFLSREYDGGRSSPTRRISSPPQSGDDGSDFSFSSADTAIFMAERSGRGQSPNGKSLVDRSNIVRRTEQLSSPRREVMRDSKEEYHQMNGDVYRDVSPGYVQNGYGCDDRYTDSYEDDITNMSNEISLSEGLNRHDDDSLRLSNGKTSLHSPLSSKQTHEKDFILGQPQSPLRSPSNSLDVSGINSYEVGKTTSMRQSSSDLPTKNVSADLESAFNQHLTPTNHVHATGGTQIEPNSWTLVNGPFEGHELKGSRTGDLSSRNHIMNSLSPNGMVNDISGKQNDCENTSNLESMSRVDQISPNSDTMDSEVYVSYQSAHREETLIHTVHGDNDGSLPETAVTDEINMKGMQHIQGESEGEGYFSSVNGQQILDISRSSPHKSSPEQDMLKDMPLSHPSIVVLQNENNSDTSSVDSDGVPYKKSNLKTTKSKHDGSKRTGRKVRFAEPLEVLEENKPIQLTARERLGLSNKSGGGNLYTYIPSFGLKQQLAVEENQLNKPVTGKVTKHKKSVRFSEDTKFDTNSTDSDDSELTREQVTAFTGNPDANYVTEQIHTRAGNTYDAVQNEYLDYTNTQSSPVSPKKELGTSGDTASRQSPSPSPPRNKIVRRPGIHVTRPKVGLNQSEIYQSNEAINPSRLEKSLPVDHDHLSTSSGVRSSAPVLNRYEQKQNVDEGFQGTHQIQRPYSQYRSDSPSLSNNHAVILRAKNSENIQRTQEARYGRLLEQNSLDHYTSLDSDKKISLNQSNAGDNGHALHVKHGQKAFPNSSGSPQRLSHSSSDTMLSDPRRNSGALPEYHSSNDYLTYNGLPADHMAPRILSPRAAQQIQPGTIGRYPQTPGPDLDVTQVQGDTSSVPSPVSGDSGISSSSSLTDINSQQPNDNLGDNYSTLTYIQRNKTKHIMDRMSDMRRSHGKINPPQFRNQITSPPLPNMPVVRRDSGRNENRRAVMSDISVGSGGDVRGSLDQWNSVMDRSPHDDSHVAYDPRRTSVTSQASDINYAGPKFNGYSPERPHQNHRYPQDNQSPNPGGSQNRPDEEIYERLRQSKTNRVPAKSNLVAIPMDILNPRSPTPQPLQEEPSNFMKAERMPQSVQRRENFGNPRYSYASNADDSSLYSGYNGSPQPMHQSGLHQQERHINGPVRNSPQYSSSADILKMLQKKSRNPFVKPEGYG